MTLVSIPPTPVAEGEPLSCRVADGGRRVVVTVGDEVRTIHPLWLIERSLTPCDVDATNHQRLTEPTDIGLDTIVTDVVVAGPDVVVRDATGRHSTVPIARLLVDLGLRADPEARPPRVTWRGEVDRFPTLDWSDADDTDSLIDVLDGFFRLGFMRLRNTPTRLDSLLDIAGHFGHVNPTNFGVLFDVRSVPDPVDLAYTPVGLAAHTDQPYRRPSPCIQFLHALVNDAPGGDSTIVDGLAAAQALADADPDAFEVLATTEVEFRYDIGSDVVVGRAPVFEFDRHGELARIRYSTRIDFAPAVDPDLLDVYYRGRRWLSEFLNDPSNRIEFRLEAGDALVVDNARVLHGRTPFDPSAGDRHLQGCYIDHDGPDTLWRLTHRRRAATV